MKKANIVRYMEEEKMGLAERRPHKMGMEDPGSKLTAPPPSSGGTPQRAREVMAKKWPAVTEAPRDRQDKTQRAKAIHRAELPGTGASSHEEYTVHRVGLTTMSKTRAVVARETLINLIMKKEKWEQLNGAKKIPKTNAYQGLRNMVLKVRMPELRYGNARDKELHQDQCGGDIWVHKQTNIQSQGIGEAGGRDKQVHC